MLQNTVRDELKDRIRNTLAGYHRIDLLEVDSDLVATLADEAFAICGVTEDQQDKPYRDPVETTFLDLLAGRTADQEVPLSYMWKAIPWDGQYEIRDGDRTIGFVGKKSEGAIPSAEARAYANLICAVPLFLRVYSLLLDREDIADSELGDLLREVAQVATGQRKLSKELLKELGITEGKNADIRILP